MERWLGHVLVEASIEVELKLDKVLELLVLLKLTTHRVQVRLVEKTEWVGHALRVVHVREDGSPEGHKLSKCRRQVVYKLLVEVEYIKKHVVANEDLFVVDQLLDD